MEHGKWQVELRKRLNLMRSAYEKDEKEKIKAMFGKMKQVRPAVQPYIGFVTVGKKQYNITKGN